MQHMIFDIGKAIEILERTPNTLVAMLQDVSEDWTMCNEGEATFSPYDVVGHLIHGEKTDWIARMDIIFMEGTTKAFSPYDRFAQYEESKGKTLNALLQEFTFLRSENLKILKFKRLTQADLERTGLHPALGVVTLGNLLATWVVHDLSHLGQIARVMAKQYKSEVGAWEAYLPILNK